MKSSVSMRAIFAIILLIALAVLLALFYFGALNFLSDLLNGLGLGI